MAISIPKQNEGRNWVALMMLCWALGMWGAHRFYAKRLPTAWLMLLLNFTGVGALITFVISVFDGLAIALGQFKHADGSKIIYERIEGLGNLYISMILGVIILVALIYVLLSSVIPISLPTSVPDLIPTSLLNF